MPPAKPLDLVDVRPRLPVSVAEYLDAQALVNRRVRQDEAGLYIERWVARHAKHPLPPPERPEGADGDKIDIRVSITRSTREALKQLASSRGSTMSVLMALILEDWARRKKPAWRGVRRHRRARGDGRPG